MWVKHKKRNLLRFQFICILQQWSTLPCIEKIACNMFKGTAMGQQLPNLKKNQTWKQIQFFFEDMVW